MSSLTDEATINANQSFETANVSNFVNKLHRDRFIQDTATDFPDRQERIGHYAQMSISNDIHHKRYDRDLIPALFDATRAWYSANEDPKSPFKDKAYWAMQQDGLIPGDGGDHHGETPDNYARKMFELNLKRQCPTMRHLLEHIIKLSQTTTILMAPPARYGVTCIEDKLSATCAEYRYPAPLSPLYVPSHMQYSQNDKENIEWLLFETIRRRFANDDAFLNYIAPNRSDRTRIPMDLRLKIVKLLDYNDAVAIADASRAWKRVFAPKHNLPFWREIYMKRYHKMPPANVIRHPVQWHHLLAYQKADENGRERRRGHLSVRNFLTRTLKIKNVPEEEIQINYLSDEEEVEIQWANLLGIVDHTARLPMKLRFQIMKLLDYTDAVAMAYTSRAWKRVFAPKHNLTFWRGIYMERYYKMPPAKAIMHPMQWHHLLAYQKADINRLSVRKFLTSTFKIETVPEEEEVELLRCQSNEEAKIQWARVAVLN